MEGCILCKKCKINMVVIETVLCKECTQLLNLYLGNLDYYLKILRRADYEVKDEIRLFEEGLLYGN